MEGGEGFVGVIFVFVLPGGEDVEASVVHRGWHFLLSLARGLWLSSLDRQGLSNDLPDAQFDN